jgi:hypothetical protein
MKSNEAVKRIVAHCQSVPDALVFVCALSFRNITEGGVWHQLERELGSQAKRDPMYQPYLVVPNDKGGSKVIFKSSAYSERFRQSLRGTEPTMVVLVSPSISVTEAATIQLGRREGSETEPIIL